MPDPSLVVLVGAAGSGKSTFAARHFSPDEVLSSDAFRAIIAGDEADQTATRPAFSILHREVTRRLARGHLTVVDATNVEAHARRALLKRARIARVPAVALVFDLPPSLVLARNRARSARVVHTSIMADHLALVRRTVDAGVIEHEGFAAVYRIRSSVELEGVRIARRAEARSDRPGRPFG